MAIEKINKLNLEDYHLENEAKLISFANYRMPLSYKRGIIQEHLTTRSNYGLFDVSHMLQVSIKYNNDTLKNLEKIIPLDLKKLEIGKSNYSFILNKNGGIVDDLIISKITDNNDNIFFYIVLNASRRQIDLKILNEINGNKDFVHERNNFCLLAFQGPKSREILKQKFSEVNDLRFMEVKEMEFENHKIIISCSGYTGEDGFELSIPNKICLTFIKKIFSDESINLCGLGSRDTLRLEAGLCLYGNELNEKITPYESLLMWAISQSRKQKRDFLGADIILDKNSNNLNKTRIGIISNTNSIPRSNVDIYNKQNKLIGNVTSGSYSPSLKRPIAMASVYSEDSEIGNEVFFNLRGKKESAIISKLPFIPHNYNKIQ